MQTEIWKQKTLQVNKICVADEVSKNTENCNKNFVILPFYFDGKPVLDKNIRWGMSLKNSGSMSFRWNETNQNRIKLLQKLCSSEFSEITSSCDKNFIGNIYRKTENNGDLITVLNAYSSQKTMCDKVSAYNSSKTTLIPVATELIHSKKIIFLENENDSQGKQCDGLITCNKNLLTTVTVADCMPIFLFDIKNSLFGVLHSGWKGTGIVEEAINFFTTKLNSNIENICVVLGPHIQDCCYIVDENRSEYFEKNFTRECVKPISDEVLKTSLTKNWNSKGKKLFCLSLAKANLAILQKLGVNDKNIAVCTDCTCCTKGEVFGSFRRETEKAEKNLTSEELRNFFTVQVAFCGALSQQICDMPSA